MSVDTSDLVVALARALRRVRTPEGSALYGLPIGAIITKDAVAKAKSNLAAQGLSPEAIKAKLGKSSTSKPGGPTQAAVQGQQTPAVGAGTAPSTPGQGAGPKAPEGPSLGFTFNGKTYQVEADSKVFESTTVSGLTYTYSEDTDTLRAFTEKDGEITVPDMVKEAVKKRIVMVEAELPESNFEDKGSVAKAFIDAAKPGTSIDLKPIGGDYKTYTKDADGSWTNPATKHTIGSTEWLEAKIRVGQFKNIQEPGATKKEGEAPTEPKKKDRWEKALESVKAAPVGSTLELDSDTYTKKADDSWVNGNKEHLNDIAVAEWKAAGKTVKEPEAKSEAPEERDTFDGRLKKIEDAPVGSTMTSNLGSTYTKQANGNWQGPSAKPTSAASLAGLWGQGLLKGKIEAPKAKPEAKPEAKAPKYVAGKLAIGSKVTTDSGTVYTHSEGAEWVHGQEKLTTSFIQGLIDKGATVKPSPSGATTEEEAEFKMASAPTGTTITSLGGDIFGLYTKQSDGTWESNHKPGQDSTNAAKTSLLGGGSIKKPGEVAPEVQEEMDRLNAQPVGSTFSDLSHKVFTKQADGSWDGKAQGTLSAVHVAELFAAGKVGNGGEIDPPGTAFMSSWMKSASKKAWAAPIGTVVVGPGSGSAYTKTGEDTWEGPPDSVPVTNNQVGKWVNEGQELTKPSAAKAETKAAAPETEESGEPLSSVVAQAAVEAAPEGSFVIKGPQSKYVKDQGGVWRLEGTTFKVQSSDVAALVSSGRLLNPPGAPDLAFSHAVATKNVDDAPVGSAVVNPVNKAKFVKGANGEWSSPDAVAPKASVVAWVQGGATMYPPAPETKAAAAPEAPVTAGDKILAAPVGSAIINPFTGTVFKKSSAAPGSSWKSAAGGVIPHSNVVGWVANGSEITHPEGEDEEEEAPAAPAGMSLADAKEALEQAPVGTVLKPEGGGAYTKNASGDWVSPTAGYGSTYILTQFLQKGKATLETKGVSTLQKVIDAPVGSSVKGAASGKKFVKQENGFWLYKSSQGTLEQHPAHQVAKFIDQGGSTLEPPEAGGYVPGTTPTKAEIEDALIGTRVAVGNTLIFYLRPDGMWQREGSDAVVGAATIWNNVVSGNNVRWLDQPGTPEPATAAEAPSAEGARQFSLAEMHDFAPGTVLTGALSGTTFTKQHSAYWTDPSGTSYYATELTGKNFVLTKEGKAAPVEVGETVNSVTDADAVGEGSQIEIGGVVYTKNADLEWTSSTSWYGKSSSSLLQGNTTGKMPVWKKINPVDNTPSVPNPGKQISKKEMMNAPVGSVIYRGSFFRKLDNGKWASLNDGKEYEWNQVWQSYGATWVNADDLKVEPGRPVLSKKALVEAATGTVVSSQVVKTPGVYLKGSDGFWERIDKPGGSKIASNSFNMGNINNPNWKWTFLPGQGKKVTKPDGTVTTAPDPDQKIAPAPKYQVIAPSEGGKAALEPGGPEFTVEQLTQAIETLEAAKGIMVKQPLAKVGNPLANTDYKALAKAFDPNQMTKQAFTALLKKKRDELLNGVPLQEIDKANTSGKVSLEEGGPEFTVQELDQAIETLEGAKGIMVKQPLAKVGNPIADTPYKALAGAHDPTVGTKVAFIALLKAKREQAVAKSLGTTDQIPEPGAPNPSGVKPGVYESAGKINGETAYLVVHGDGTGTMHLPGGAKTSLDAAKASELASQKGNKYVGDTIPGKPASDLAKTGVPAKTTVAAAKKLKKFGSFPPGNYFSGTGEMAVTITKGGAWHFKTGGDWFEIEEDNKAWVTAHMQAKFLQGELMDEFGNSIAPYGHTGTVRFFGAKISVPDLAEVEAEIISGNKSVKDVLQDKVPEVFEPGVGALDPNLNDSSLAAKIEPALENLLLATKNDKPLGKAAESFTFNSQGEADLPFGVVSLVPMGPGGLQTYWMSAPDLASVRAAAQDAFGPSIGQHWTAMSIEQRRVWVEALVKGDFKAMYAYELDGAKKKGVAHATGYQHPGHPSNQSTHSIAWAPAVPGEMKAGQKPEGSWSALKNMSDEEIDNYLIAAHMGHPEHLSKEERREWVKEHSSPNAFQLSLDKLSLLAKSRADSGAAPLTAKPVWTDGVEPVKAYKPLLANNQFPGTIPTDAINDWWDDYGSTLSDELKAAAAQDIGYTASYMFGSGAPSSYAKTAAYGQWINAQREAYEEELNKPVFSIDPTVKIKKGTNQGILPLTDQFGRKYVFKPTPPGKTFRAEVEQLGLDVARHFGFPAARSRVMEFDGQTGILQEKLEAVGDLLGHDYSTLTPKQAAAIAGENVLDWIIDNDDTHGENMLIRPDGSLVSIDKGRAFVDLGHWKGLSGDHRADSQNSLIYTKLYDALRSGKLGPEAAEAAYKEAMRRAKSIQKASDDDYRALLESGLANRDDFLKGKSGVMSTAKLIDGALARKATVITDVEAMWTKIYKDAGLGDLPELGKGKIGDGFAGIANPDLLADIELAGLASKSAMVNLASADAHVLTWQEERNNKIDVVGQFKVGSLVQETIISKLAAEVTGTKTPVVVATTAPQLIGNDSYYDVQVAASAAGAKFNSNSETDEDKEKVENLKLAVKEIEENIAFLDTAPAPSLTAATGEGLIELPNGEAIDAVEAPQYRAMYAHYQASMGKTLNRIEERLPVSANKVKRFEPYKPTTGGEEYVSTDGSTAVPVMLGGEVHYLHTKPDKTSVLLGPADTKPWQGVSEGGGKWSVVGGEAKSGGYKVQLIPAGSLATKGAMQGEKTKKVVGAMGSSVNPGKAYLITLDSGEQIEVRDASKTSTLTSQQGLITYRVAGVAAATEAGTGLERVESFLTSLGVDIAPAEEDAAENVYWRQYADTVLNRSHKSGTPGEKMQAALKARANKEGVKSDDLIEHLALKGDRAGELAFYRDLFKTHLTAEQFARVETEELYLPRFDNQSLDNPDLPTGVPYYLRPDVDASAIHKKGKFLGTYWKRRDDALIQVLQSGAGMSTESRYRTLGYHKTGMSSSADQGTGGANSVFTRVTSGYWDGYNKKPFTIIWSPDSVARMSTFAFPGDRFGDLSKRAGQAPFDPVSGLDHSATDNETMIQDSAAILTHMEFMQFESSAKRDQAIKILHDAGITEIRGMKVEDRLIMSSAGKAAVAKAQQEMKKNA